MWHLKNISTRIMIRNGQRGRPTLLISKMPIKKIPGVTTEIHVPPLGNHTPTLRISWDASKVKISDKELRESLRNANPSIELGGGKENTVNVTVFMLKPGQEKIVATGLKRS